MTKMLEVALDYASRGWLVLPLQTPTSAGPKEGPDRARCSCRNDQCGSQGKHPRTKSGLSDATCALDTVRGWWTQWPDANIGLRTGEHFDVVDFDNLEAVDAFNERFRGRPSIDGGPMVLTGRGIHCFTEPANELELEGRRIERSNIAGIQKLDYRGRGGYVVAPPSLHYLGNRYRWVDGHGADAPLDPAATWLADAQRPQAAAPLAVAARPAVPVGDRDSRYWIRTLEGLCRTVATAAVGTRNEKFSWAVWKITSEHAPAGMPNVMAALDAVGQAGREAGLTEAEMTACVRTAARKTGLAA